MASNEFQARMTKGGLAFKNQDYHAALDEYNKATKKEPGNGDGWYNKAIVLQNLMRDEEAVEAYKKSIKIDKKNIKAWNNLVITWDRNIVKYCIPFWIIEKIITKVNRFFYFNGIKQST